MSRVASRSFVMTALGLFVAANGVLAQPTPGPGPWSAAHPIWFDLDGDGVPQSNELMGYPQSAGTGCTQVVALPSGIPGTGTTSPCVNVYQSNGITGDLSQPDGRVQHLSSNATGTQFTFSEESPAYNKSQNGHSGVRALATTASGMGTLLDLNGDGIYETMEIAGSTLSGPIPTTRMSLVPTDVTGDGRPDYISVPWTTSGAGLLGVSTPTTPQIYLPLTDTNGDGWPDTITAQVGGSDFATTSGPPVSGGALAAEGAAIPSASTFGLFVFAAAVVALGVKLLRGTVIAS